LDLQTELLTRCKRDAGVDDAEWSPFADWLRTTLRGGCPPLGIYDLSLGFRDGMTRVTLTSGHAAIEFLLLRVDDIWRVVSYVPAVPADPSESHRWGLN
jgi:hypothetical protein